MERRRDQNTVTDKFAQSGAFSSKEGPLELKDKDQVHVKLEVKEYALLLVEKKVLLSGLKMVEKLLKQTKELKAQLQLKTTPEGEANLIKARVHQGDLTKVEEKLQETLALIDAAKEASEAEVKELLKLSKELVKVTEEQTDHSKQALKKLQNYLDSK